MSETKERYHFKPNVPAIISMTIEDRDKLVADARRQALEEACKVLCHPCRMGKPVFKKHGKHWWHDMTPGLEMYSCQANLIRRIIEG